MFVEDANRMPNEGLLHSIPDTISSRSKLQQLINQCVNDDDNGDRFVTVSLLLELFNKMLVKWILLVVFLVFEINFMKHILPKKWST